MISGLLIYQFITLQNKIHDMRRIKPDFKNIVDLAWHCINHTSASNVQLSSQCLNLAFQSPVYLRCFNNLYVFFFFSAFFFLFVWGLKCLDIEKCSVFSFCTFLSCVLSLSHTLPLMLSHFISLD